MATAPTKSKTPKTSTVPADETKAQKFSRIASARVTAAVEKIGLIGNLAGPTYEYTPEQIKRIGEVLNAAVKDALIKFDPNQKKAANQIKI